LAAKQWLLGVAAASLLFLSAAPSPVSAASSSTPYESYNYNYWEEGAPSPAAYVPARTVSGTDLGVGSFLEPSDLYTAVDGLIYVADTGNNRIVVMTDEWKVDRVIDSFENEGKKDSFNMPSGVYVDELGSLFVADTNNGRVVVLHKDGTLKLIVDNPQSDILAAGFKFVPLKVAVDKAQRVYVVANGVYEGVMQFDSEGSFIGYVGTNKVQRDYTEIFWRIFSTKAQKAKMVLFIPTEFSNIDMDHKGFVYATNIDPNSKEPIKRLNPSGEDVLKRYGYFAVVGDIRFRMSVGPSKFVDIKVMGDGIYSALDSNQGKIFTYDDEGNLLYVYGSKGNQVGTFKTPVAIDRSGQNHLVLDRGKGNIAVFEPTLFGQKVNEASQLHYNGRNTEAVPIWEEVLRLNANYDIAYIGIGRSLLMEKQNGEAMDYFELGMDRKNYSVAYKRHRRELMKEHFSSFMTTVVILAAVLAAFLLARAWRKRKPFVRAAAPQTKGGDRAL